MSDVENTNKIVAPAIPAIDIPHTGGCFTPGDLATLRTDLLQSGVDSFQAADIVTTFLRGRGYGITADEARSVSSAVGFAGSVESLQIELGRVARAA